MEDKVAKGKKKNEAVEEEQEEALGPDEVIDETGEEPTETIETLRTKLDSSRLFAHILD